MSSFGVSVKFSNKSPEVRALLEKAYQNGLEAIGIEAEKFAKKTPDFPVDTGRARNSITWATKKQEGKSFSYKADAKGSGETFSDQIGSGAEEKSVYIGSNVKYFPNIEMGGRGHKAHHPLQKSASEHGDRYKQLMEMAMKSVE